MSYQTDYFAEERVIYSRCFDDLTLEDTVGFNASTQALVRAGDAPVHVIFDTSDVRRIGVDLKQLIEVVTFPRESKLGWVFVVGGNPLARFFASMVMQAGRVKYRFVDSVDEAVNLLKRVDATLPEM